MKVTAINFVLLRDPVGLRQPGRPLAPVGPAVRGCSVAAAAMAG